MSKPWTVSVAGRVDRYANASGARSKAADILQHHISRSRRWGQSKLVGELLAAQETLKRTHVDTLAAGYSVRIMLDANAPLDIRIWKEPT